MNDLELFVVRANVERFTRMLSTEADKAVRGRISALLDEERRKLNSNVAACHCAIDPPPDCQIAGELVAATKSTLGCAMAWLRSAGSKVQ
jgi:hypothetical protein